jgi:hypothetical protein
MLTEPVTFYLNASIKKPYHRVRYPARFFFRRPASQRRENTFLSPTTGSVN